MVIGQGDQGFDKGFWGHHDSLNPWTLNFNEKDVEHEYRAHFADSAEKYAAQKTPVGRHQDIRVEDQSQTGGPGGSKYRYSGVFIDILVAAMIFIISSLTRFFFIIYTNSFSLYNFSFLAISPPTDTFLFYFISALVLVLGAIFLIGVPLLSRRSFIPWVNLWTGRHITGRYYIKY